MKFLKLSKLFGTGWGRKSARRAAKSAPPNRLRLRLEELEDRIAPSASAILPAVTVNNTSVFGSGFNPQIVIDPVNSLKMVEVHSTGTALAGKYTTDGGTNWNALAFSGNVADPNQATAVFAAVSGPSVSFDSLQNFYVVDTQHDAANTSGAVVIEKFSFASGTATKVNGTQNVLYRWLNQDAAANPVVGVDTNPTTFSDPQTGATQNDSLANTRMDATYGVVPKAVYVAWNVNSTQLGGGLTSKVMVEASEDGGQTFSTMQRAGVGSAPQILFTQQSADRAVNGGKLSFVWSNGTAIIMDQSSPDGGVAATPVVATQTFAFAGGAIADATSSSTNLSWTLNGQIDATQTTLTVNAGGPTPPNPNFNVKIDQETLTVTGTSGNLWTVVRGVSSTAAAHLTNSNVTYTATGTNDIPQVTTFNGTVNITQADLTTIKDLDVTINMIHPNLDQVKITLQGPVGTPINLVLNRVDKAGATLAQGVAAGVNMGELVRSGSQNDAGTVFDQSADRSITDGSASAEYVGHFRPESGSLSQFNGLSAASVDGTWTISITDFRNSSNPTQSLKNWSLNFTGLIDTTGFGADNVVTGAATVPGSATNTYTSTGAAYGTPGVGPGVVVAQDKTLGSYSQYQGRIYLAYTQGTYNLAGALVDTNVYLKYSDNNGASWSTGKRVNDDSASDNFSEGNRPQFTPSITVDQSTGTLVVSYYDARNDASLTRVATSIVASVDGGADFSPVSYLNQHKTATDFLTGKVSDLGPIPGNQSQAGANGFGDREGIVANAGQIFAVYASNANAAGSSIYLGKAVTAAGPRVLSGDMGPVIANFTNGAFTYNNTIAADGTRKLSGFVVQFDRPVDVSTFNSTKVKVQYQDPNSGAVSTVAVGGVTALDSNGFGPRSVGVGALAETFYVSLQTPQTKVGTYSYSVGPDISDKIRTAVTTYTLVAPTGAFVNPFASTDTPIAIPDLTTITSSISGVPTLPAGQVIGKVTVTLDITHTYDSDLAITLISPTGTRVLLSNHNGPGRTNQNFTGTTFDDAAATAISAGTPPYSGSYTPDSPLSALIGQDTAGTWKLEVADTVAIDSGTLNSWSVKFTPATISTTSTLGNRMDQNANSITNEASVDAFAIPTPTNGIPFTAPYDTTTLPLIIPGPYVASTSVLFNPAASVGATDNLILNSTNNGIDVTFDRDIKSSTFTAAQIVSMIGPTGAISGPFTVTPATAGASSRSFRVTFATQTLSGTYYIVLGSSITDTFGNALDTNQNAGVDVLRGNADPATATVITKTYAADYGTTGVNIAPKSTYTATISVADGFQIAQSAAQGKHIQLELNLLHQNIPDLSATLTGPDGQVIQLFSGAGTFGTTPRANFSNTVLDDSASNSIQATGTPISTGPFTPKTQLSVEDGKGSFGNWTLTITNNSTIYAGTLTHWEIRLPKAVASSGLGEPTADQSTVSFRIFTQATTNSQSSTQWTPIGPASANSGSNSGRIGGLAVDPSDPSGNTVFVAGASGGIWKTNNFLTTSANGPTYVQLTDLGPSYSLNIGSLAVFGRNNDPNQTVVFAATGEGSTGTSGTGFLRSMDGGKTWQVLDSTTNVDGNGNILLMNSASRNHSFVGSTSFKIVVDPTATTDGKIAVYAALSTGLWRSLDSGGTWFKVRAGNATDVVLAAASGDANGNLSVLYAAFEGEGVYITFNALTASSLSLMAGGQVSTPRVDEDLATRPQITTTAPSSTPNGAKGRIVLATPALTNNPLQDRFYQGWLYAVVITTTGSFDGLYMTKDFGLNWTKLNLPGYTPSISSAYGTNNETRTNYDVVSHTTGTGAKFAQGNYDISLAIDPNNPNITYIGGTSDGAPTPAGGFIRVDSTTVSDPYSLIAYSNDEAAGGTQLTTTGDTSIHVKDADHAGPGGTYGIYDDYGLWTQAVRNSYLNLYRTPSNPFSNPSTLHFTNIGSFNNDGQDVKWMGFNDAFASSTDQHQLLAIRDSVTGKTRLIFGDDQGVWTGVDKGDGTLITSVGTQNITTYSRNGNLQITQFYYGASQPSTLAAELAGSMYYGMAQDNGSLNSAKNVLTTGNLNWTGVPGDGTGVATDQTGGGTKYEYRWSCCINQSPFTSTDFFLVKFAGQTEASRVSGLVQTGDDPLAGTGQWPFTGGSNFAVNNYDPTAIVISSQAGRIFLTSGGTTTTGLGYGVQWHVIGNPSDLDGTYAAAVAFGAPSAAGVGTKDDFIYAGTQGGKIFVTFTGGGYNGSSKWRDISTGLDGSAVQSIVTNTKFGSHEAYAVTLNGVYWMQDSNSLSPKWIKISDVAGASTTIAQASGIAATDTQVTVTSSAGLPTTPFYAKIGSEIVQVTAVNPTTTTLAAGIDNAVTSITVASSALFPSPNFVIQIDSEQMQVTAVAGTTWTVTRGYNGTTKANHGPTATITGLNPMSTLTIVRGINGTTAVAAANGATFSQDSGLLFGLSRPVFNNSNDQYPSIKYLTSLAVDWRYSVPDQTNTANPTTTINQAGGIAANDKNITVASVVGFPTGSFIVQIDSEQILVSNITGTTWTNVFRGYNGTTATAHANNATITQINLSHPVLYVGGEGGVYRTRDNGQAWTDFPNIATDAATQDGGWLPNVHVTDLDLQLGNFNTTTGFYDSSTGTNLLQATTYGRGVFVIRLDNSSISQYAVAPVSGPKVTNLSQISANNGTKLAGFSVTFAGAVDGSTFDTSDVTVTGPNGVVALASVTGSNTSFQINFTSAQSTAGNYTISIGPNVMDFSGNKMDQDNDNVNGGADDVYTGTSFFTPNTPPTITSISNIVLAPAPGSPTSGSRNFTVGDAQDSPGTLAVTASSSNTTVMPNGNITLSGFGTANRTIQLTSTNQTGSSTITVTVTDSGGLTAQSTFTVFVDKAPTMNTISSPQIVAHGSPPTNISLGANQADNEQLTFKVTLTDPIYTNVSSVYGLYTSEITQYYNAYGAREKWFQSTSNSYYVLTPDNKLYLWNGGIVSTLAATPVGDFTTATYSNVDVYANPALMTSFDPLATLRSTYGLNTGGQAFNGYGQNEWYFRSSNGSNPAGSGYYVLTSGNKLYTWDGSSYATSTANTITPVADFNTAAYNNYNVYGDPLLLMSQGTVNPTPRVTVPNATYDLMTKYGLNTAATSINATGANDKWLHSSNGSNPNHGGWFILLPNNTLVAWDGSAYANGTLVTDLTSYSQTTTINQVGGISAAATTMTVASNSGFPTMPFVIQIDNEQIQVTNANTTTWTIVRGVNGTSGATHANGATVTASIYLNPTMLTSTVPTTAVGVSASVSPNPYTPPPAGGVLTITPTAGFERSVIVKVSVSDGISDPVTQTFTYTVTNSAPTLAAVGSQSVAHNTASTQVNLTATDTGDNSTKIYSVDVTGSTSSYPLESISGQYGLDTADGYYNQSNGQFEKWLRSSNGNNYLNGGWYLLMPDSKLYAWNGASIATSIAGGASSKFFVADFLTAAYGNQNVYATPSLLYNARKVLTPTVNVNRGQLYDVKVQYGLNTADAYFNQTGSSEKWLQSSNGSNAGAGAGWYILMPTGKLYAWDGVSLPLAGGQTPVADLSNTNAYYDPSLLYKAQPVYVGDAGYNAKQLYGLYTADGSYNAGGLNEKWLKSSTGSNSVNRGYYFLTTNGDLHSWDGTVGVASGPVVASLGVAIYNDPSLIYSSTGQALGATATVNGSGQVTLTRNVAFAGTLRVTATESDGAEKASQSFLFTVTEAAPILNAITNASSATGPGTKTVNFLAATDSDSGAAPSGSNETLTYAAAITDNPLNSLKNQLGLTTAPYGSSPYGQGETWFQSSNGSNAAHSGWYFLTTSNNLYAWDGSSYNSTIARTAVASFNVSGSIYEGSDVYSNPSLLYNAMPTNLSALSFSSLSAGSITLNWTSGFTGKFLVTIFVGDGARETQRSFLMTVN